MFFATVRKIIKKIETMISYYYIIINYNIIITYVVIYTTYIFKTIL